MESTRTIDELPDELLLSIFRMLPASVFVVVVPRVSNRWSALIASDTQTLKKIGFYHLVDEQRIQFFYTDALNMHLKFKVFREPMQHCNMVLRMDMSNLGPSLNVTDPYFFEREADLFCHITITIAMFHSTNEFLVNIHRRRE